MQTPRPRPRFSRVALPIPINLRDAVMNNLRRAYLSDYEWHLKPDPDPNARVEGEQALDKFLVAETSKICKRLRITGDDVGLMANMVTDPRKWVEWYSRVDFVTSLGEYFDFERFCPEKADVLPIIYGSSAPGSKFRTTLNVIFREWIKEAIRDKREEPPVTEFRIKPLRGVDKWVISVEEPGTSILTQDDQRHPTYFLDELMECTTARDLEPTYVMSKRRGHWRCRMAVAGGDLEYGEVSASGYAGTRLAAMEEAARAIMRKLRVPIGVRDSVERRSSPAATKIRFVFAKGVGNFGR
ncbi:hypothetical protein TWF718_003474 [Orbilia javanica]|uniref:Uncharacterized protein n=1 Tax=Orbilia javanica TaxID=47235 RepID=A0AAN8MNP4_9PEZI